MAITTRVLLVLAALAAAPAALAVGEHPANGQVVIDVGPAADPSTAVDAAPAGAVADGEGQPTVSPRRDPENSGRYVGPRPEDAASQQQ